MRFAIDETVFRIEWRHRRARKRLAVEAITTCVLMMHSAEFSKDDDYVAIGIAVCCKGDRFSRRQGRLDSLDRLLHEYRHLDEWATRIYAAFDAQFPLKPKRARKALGSTEIHALITTPEAVAKRYKRSKTSVAD